MHKPNIFICGESGSGKSTSLRNLNPDSAIILNTERKTLPFRKATQFKKQVMVERLDQYLSALNRAMQSDAEIVITDSFTSLSEFAYDANVRYADKSGDGSFKAWDSYKFALKDILLQCKQSDKYFVFIGIDDAVQNENLQFIRQVAVQGGLKGQIEKEFEIVLWTKILNNENGYSYHFQTNSDGTNKAKTPMGMFDDLFIDNDLNHVIQKIETYYSGEQ